MLGSMKDKPRAPRKTTARSAPKAPATEPAASPPAGASDVARLKDELRRVDQDLSRLARASRPDAVRHQPLTEKQDLLARKADLERKIRGQTRV
jgi:hypothetical protein